jgi:hypothetical protein
LRKLKDQYTIVLCALLRDGSIDESSASAKELQQITIVPLTNEEFDLSLECLRTTCEETFSLGEHEVWYVCNAYEQLRSSLVGQAADGANAPLPPKPDTPEDSVLAKVGGNETVRWIMVELEAAEYVAPPDIVPWLIAFFDGEYTKPSDGVSDFLGSVPQSLLLSIMSKTLPKSAMIAALTLLGEVWPHFSPATLSLADSPVPLAVQRAELNEGAARAKTGIPTPLNLGAARGRVENLEWLPAEEAPLTPPAQEKKTPAGASSTLAGTGVTMPETDADLPSARS